MLVCLEWGVSLQRIWCWRWHGHMSGNRTTPRFQVIASTRRSWSREQKRAAILGEIGVGEATLSDVARRHGIRTSLLFR